MWAEALVKGAPGVATPIDKPGVIGTTPYSGRGVAVDCVSAELFDKAEGELGRMIDGGAFRRCMLVEVVLFWRFLR